MGGSCMKKDDREILVEVQKNSQMAVKEIDTISEKTCDDIMRYELVKEKRKKIKKELEYF